MTAREQPWPHDVGAERAVLGGVLLENAGLAVLRELGLRADHFYDTKHEAIATAILGLHAAGQDIDGVTLRAWLSTAGALKQAGGDEYLLGLTDTIPTVANVRSHAKIVLEKSALRRVKGSLLAGAAAAQGGEFEAAQEHARAALDVKPAKRVEVYGPRALIQSAVDSSRSSKHGSIRTGFRLLDGVIEPLAPGEAVIVGGRPGCGKSHLILQIVLRAARAGHTVGVVSCEDPKRRWGGRLGAALEPNLTTRQLTSAQLNFEQVQRLERAFAAGDKLPLHYVDAYEQGLPEVLDGIAALGEMGCTVIAVDHLHAINVELERGETVASAVSRYVRNIKRATRGLGAVLLLGAQIGRPEKSNRYSEPGMHDFRDSSQIEIAADVMLITWKQGDADNAPIYGKIAKLKDEPRRTRFQFEFAENGSLFELLPYTPAVEEEKTGSRGWRT